MPSGLGIDLGTANTVVCQSGRGVVWEGPSVMALRAGRRGGKLVALGRQAAELLDREPDWLAAVRPLEDGVIGDLETARMFLVAVLREAGVGRWRRPRRRAVLALPAGTTPLERRAMLEVAGKAGLGHALPVAGAVTGALACGVDPMDSRAHMVLDVGAGTAELTVFCFGTRLSHRSSRVAGDEMTMAVRAFLRERHHLTVSTATAEEIKGLASSTEGPSMLVRGVDAASGRPAIVTVEVGEIHDAVRPVLDAMVQILSAGLRDLAPRVVNDVTEEGILTIGGGCLMRDLAKVFESALGFPLRPAERPVTCVAEGAAICTASPGSVAAMEAV